MFQDFDKGLLVHPQDTTPPLVKRQHGRMPPIFHQVQEILSNQCKHMLSFFTQLRVKLINKFIIKMQSNLNANRFQVTLLLELKCPSSVDFWSTRFHNYSDIRDNMYNRFNFYTNNNYYTYIGKYARLYTYNLNLCL